MVHSNKNNCEIVFTNKWNNYCILYDAKMEVANNIDNSYKVSFTAYFRSDVLCQGFFFVQLGILDFLEAIYIFIIIDKDFNVSTYSHSQVCFNSHISILKFP